MGDESGNRGDGIPDYLAALIGQQLADVDPLRLLRERAAEEAREDVVEGAGAEVARPKGGVGHDEFS
jgi:hypothetical protein